MGMIAIENVTVIPMDAERVVAGQTVIVEDGSISWVGAHHEAQIPPNADRVNGTAKYLMPGLADMHTHPLTEADLLLLVAHGVTTIRNLWGMPRHLTWRDRIARGHLLGPTIYSTGPIVDGRPVRNNWSVSVTTKEEAEEAVSATQSSGYDALKVYDQLTPAVYRFLVMAAGKRKLPVVGHVPFLVGLEGALAAGQRSIEHLYGYVDALQPEQPMTPSRRPGQADMRGALLDGAVTADERRLNDLADATLAAGTWNCPTLLVRRRWRQDPSQILQGPDARYLTPAQLKAWRRFASGYPEHSAVERLCELNLLVVKALSDAGAGLLAGTDAGIAMMPFGTSLHEELEVFVAAGLGPYKALRAATADAADFLGAASEWGTIAVGRRADLLLVDANPLADVRNAARISGVMLRGHWLPANELQARLDALADTQALGRQPPSGHADQPATGTTEQQRLAYQLELAGTPVGHEEIVVEYLPTGGSRWTTKAELDLFSTVLSAEESAAYKSTIEIDADGSHQEARFSIDGPDGPQRFEVTRLNGRLRVTSSHPLGGKTDEHLMAPDCVVLALPLVTLYRYLTDRHRDLAVGQQATLPVLGPGLAPDHAVARSAVRLERLPDLNEEGHRRYSFQLERANAVVRGTIRCDADNGLSTVELDSGVTARRA